MTKEENQTIDNLTYLTPKEKAERKEGNCTPPAIEQFPEPLMDNYYRQRGGLTIHILIAIYMFIGLAIVCDDYFVPALDRIAEGNRFFLNITILKNINMCYLCSVEFTTRCGRGNFHGGRILRA